MPPIVAGRQCASGMRALLLGEGAELRGLSSAASDVHRHDPAREVEPGGVPELRAPRLLDQAGSGLPSRALVNVTPGASRRQQRGEHVAEPGDRGAAGLA